MCCCLSCFLPEIQIGRASEGEDVEGEVGDGSDLEVVVPPHPRGHKRKVVPIDFESIEGEVFVFDFAAKPKACEGSVVEELGPLVVELGGLGRRLEIEVEAVYLHGAVPGRHGPQVEALVAVDKGVFYAIDAKAAVYGQGFIEIRVGAVQVVEGDELAEVALFKGKETAVIVDGPMNNRVFG